MDRGADASDQATTAAAGYHGYIDGLRALAIIAVVAFHLDGRLLPGGYGGVDMFFVISGFVVSQALYRQRGSSFGTMLAGFYVRRLRRILPALLAMLLVVHAAVVLFVPQAYLSRFIGDTGLAAFFGISNFYLAWNTDYFSPLAHYNPFTHTWSLAVEEQFYLLFPFLLFAVTRSRGITWFSFACVAALCLASFAYGGLEHRLSGDLGFYSSPGRFWEIGAGVLLFMWFHLRPRAGAGPAAERVALTWAGAALAFPALLLPVAAGLPVPGAVLPVLATVLVIIGLHERQAQSLPGRLLNSRAMMGIGLISYSLYLWHWPVFVLARWTTGFSSPAIKAIALLLAARLAVLSYIAVERPLRASPGLRRAMVVIPLAMAGIAASIGTVQLMRGVAPSLSLAAPTRAPDQWYPYEPLADANGCRGRKTETERGGILRTELSNSCGGAAASGTLHVLGDSHAGAYIRMLDEAARQTGLHIIIREVRGCGVLTLAPPSESCARATAEAIAETAREMKDGEVVFLPSLRLPRLYDQGLDAVQDADAIMAGWAAGLDAAVTRGKAGLAPLAARKARLLFELPKPVFAAAAFRCADWFNAGNEVCRGLSMPKAHIERLRAPVVEMAAALAAEVPALLPWDPLPLLCPQSPCLALSGGVPVFFDADHLSGAGNAMLAESFIETLRSARR